MCHLSNVSCLFTCSSKSFLNLTLSGTRLLIKWFLIKKRVDEKGYSFDIEEQRFEIESETLLNVTK